MIACHVRLIFIILKEKIVSLICLGVLQDWYDPLSFLWVEDYAQIGLGRAQTETREIIIHPCSVVDGRLNQNPWPWSYEHMDEEQGSPRCTGSTTMSMDLHFFLEYAAESCVSLYIRRKPEFYNTPITCKLQPLQKMNAREGPTHKVLLPF